MQNQTIAIIAFSAFLVLILVIFIRYLSHKKWILPKGEFPVAWKNILWNRVEFYKKLKPLAKKRFEYKVQEFLTNVKVAFIDTEEDETARVLVAASAVIPIFNFPEWQYLNLDEVILYNSAFSFKHPAMDENQKAAGMVGQGVLNRKMLLSKPSLIHGFANKTDKDNTGIHEFIHIIDMMDGEADGIPDVLIQNPVVIPWMNLMRKKMDEMLQNKSDIDIYGTTNTAEFFAVAGEYFFERPKLFKRKHPELYEHLSSMFNPKVHQNP